MDSPEYTVTGFLDHVNDFLVEEKVVIRGEISDCNHHSSGIYFSLKDEESVLPCYMSPFLARAAGLSLENGMRVKASGWPEIYKPKGRFSLRVQAVEFEGEGTLRRAYELLKKKLEEEGIFSRKRPLPFFIEKIGILTSKTGAVIGDFLNNLEPLGIKIYFFDTRVEGSRAVSGITRGIKSLSAKQLDLDAIVIMRGGGSLEDLQAFNTEEVARAIFASRVPVICGIGHDRDVPIASLAADRETSTPSIAAMLINASWDPLKTDLPVHTSRLVREAEKLIISKRNFVRRAEDMCFMKLDSILKTASRITERFIGAGKGAVARTGQRLQEFERVLAAADPSRNLRLGYSIIFNDKGRVIRETRDIKEGDAVRARFMKGELAARVEKIIKNNAERKEG